MRRAFRFLFTLIAAASLLLCIATAGLWVRSYRAVDTMEFGRVGLGLLQAASADGRLSLTAVRDWPTDEQFRLKAYRNPLDDSTFEREPMLDLRRDLNDGHFRLWTKWGLQGELGLLSTVLNPDGTPVRRPLARSGGSRDAESTKMRYWRVYGIPYRPLVAAAGLPFVLWSGVRMARAWVTRRRRRLGLCARCGYDLRGSAGRCSECGEAIATKGVAA